MVQPCWISREFNAEFKKSIPNGDILHYSVYINTTFLKGQNDIIENRSVVCQDKSRVGMKGKCIG